MKKVIKKVVAKVPVKKTVAKKPMMKSGGAKRTLRKYQGDGPEGSEVGPGGGSARPSMAAAYTANINAGLSPWQARRAAKVESGVKEPKKPVDPNTIINAIGNTAGAIGSVANAFRKPVAGSTPSGPGVNPGSTSIGNQNPEMEFEKRGGAIKKKGGAMKKLGCAQCGKAMKKGGVKKMAAGGSTTNKLNNARGFAKSPKGGGNQKLQIYGIPNAGMTGPDRNSQTETMKKGGSMKKYAKGGSTFGMLSVKAGVDNNPNATAADRIAGATKKAKFGATVKVQRSPKAGKVRSAGDQGYAAVGQREPGRVIKRTLSKKAAGGPIIDKLKAKLAERKVTKAIKKSVKSSGKIVK
jgi:hypothetical protein